jgi:hypothetical protein
MESENLFFEQMQNLGDTELLRVIGLRTEYQPAAIEAAKSIAIQRGLIDENFNYLKINDEQLTELEEIKKTIEKNRISEERRKKYKPFRIIARILIVVLVLIAAWFIYDNWHLGKVKEAIKQSIEVKTMETVAKMSMLHRQGNVYEGFIEFESKHEMHVDITIDGNSFIWKSDGSYELQNGLNHFLGN